MCQQLAETGCVPESVQLMVCSAAWNVAEYRVSGLALWSCSQPNASCVARHPLIRNRSTPFQGWLVNAPLLIHVSCTASRGCGPFAPMSCASYVSVSDVSVLNVGVWENYPMTW